MKNIPRSALILFFIAITALIANLFLLGSLDDHERIITPGNPYHFDYHETTENTYYLCTPKDASAPADTGKTLSNLSLLNINHHPIHGELIKQNGENSPVSINASPERSLTLPKDFQDKYALDSSDFECAETESVTVRPGSLSLSLPENTLVINTSSPNSHLPTITLLFIVFLVSLFGCVGILCKKFPITFPAIPFYDAPLAFVIALTIAIGCQFVFAAAIPSDQNLVPTFGTMLSATLSNLIGFIITVSIFLCLHRKRVPQDNVPKEQSIALPVVAAIILTFTGVVDVMFSPIPVMEPIEMAQNLIAPRFVHIHFAVLAGIYEELLFRGIIQTALMPRPNSKNPMLTNVIAVTVTTILFVLLHVPQSLEHAWALIPIGLVSIASGILRIRSGSIFQSILLHMSYNTLLLLVSLLRPSTLL